MLLTWGLALLGRTLNQSAAVRYQSRFREDIINVALVDIFNFSNNIGLQLSADVFQISKRRQIAKRRQFLTTNFPLMDKLSRPKIG